MDLERLYAQVKNRIDRIDFSKLWKGFSPLKFALYNDSQCFYNGAYISKTDDFLANTSIFYEGEWIAIWNVQEELDPSILTSKIVHEMFHGFQNAHGESRFPDELDALYTYRYEDGNLSVKLAENQILCQLVNAFDGEQFKRLLAMRKYRSNTFAYEYHYEACLEQIEGTANFVELKALKQLSNELFQKKLSSMQERIVREAQLFPIRIICYDVGALLLFVMSENGIAFEEGFTPVPFAESLLPAVAQENTVPVCSMQAWIDEYYDQADKIIQRAIEKNALVSDSPAELLGVNVYNAVYYQGYIISRYFVMFG